MTRTRRSVIAAASCAAMVLALTAGAAGASASPRSSDSPDPVSPRDAVSSTATATGAPPTSTSPTPSPSPTATTYAIRLVLPTRIYALRTYAVGGTVTPGPQSATRVVLQIWSQTKHGWVNKRNGTAAAGASTAKWSAGTISSNVLVSYSLRAFITVGGRNYISNAVTTTVTPVLDAAVSGPLHASDVPYSYRAGCPVAPSSLRRVTFDYWSFSGVVARGSIVVTSAAVTAVEKTFSAALGARFPLRRVIPTDYYYNNGRYSPTSSDVHAMQADDTSAFNCRPVTGDPYRISQHSYGNAVDINTYENPYVVGRSFYPSNAGTYLNRNHMRLGMINHASAVYRVMARYHWLWGGRWAHPDYQHFSSNGG